MRQKLFIGKTELKKIKIGTEGRQNVVKRRFESL